VWFRRPDDQAKTLGASYLRLHTPPNQRGPRSTTRSNSPFCTRFPLYDRFHASKQHSHPYLTPQKPSQWYVDLFPRLRTLACKSHGVPAPRSPIPMVGWLVGWLASWSCLLRCSFVSSTAGININTRRVCVTCATFESAASTRPLTTTTTHHNTDDENTMDNTAQASTNYREAFQLFDKRGNGRVDRSALGDLLRACGQNPTLAEIGDLERGVGNDCESLIRISPIPQNPSASVPPPQTPTPQ
jgi:hypothetical protein